MSDPYLDLMKRRLGNIDRTSAPALSAWPDAASPYSDEEDENDSPRFVKRDDPTPAVEPIRRRTPGPSQIPPGAATTQDAGGLFDFRKKDRSFEHVGGFASGTLVDAADLASVGTWAVPGKGKAEEATDRWREKAFNVRADYLAKGTSPGDEEHPILGASFTLPKFYGGDKVSLGELGRMANSLTGEVVGAIPILSKVIKAPVALFKLAKVHKATRAMRAGGALDDIGKAGMDMAAEGLKRGMSLEEAEDAARKFIAYADEVGDSAKPFGERMRDIANYTRHHAFSQTDAIERMGRYPRRYLQSHRDVGQRAASFVDRGVRFLDHKTGKQIRRHESLREILAGTTRKEQQHLDAFMAFTRQKEDLQFRTLRRSRDFTKHALSEGWSFKKTKAEFAKLSKNDDALKISPEKLAEQELIMERIIAEYGPDRWGKMEDMAARTRRWYQAATLDQLHHYGIINAKEHARILALNPNYAYFNHLTEGWIHKLGGEGAIDELFDADELIRGRVASAGGTATGKKPLTNIRKGLDDDNKIVSPLMSMVSRTLRLNEWISAQHVRNAVGKALEAEDVAKVGKGKTWTAIENPKLLNDPKILRRKDVFATWEDGKKKLFLTNDEHLVRALDSLEGPQATLLNQIMEMPPLRALAKTTGFFRKGTILSPEFVMRNPVRDQLVGATMSKFGYIPVVDFMKGIGYAVRRGEAYEMFHALGAGSGNFISGDLKTVAQTMDRISEPFTLGEKIHRGKAALGPGEILGGVKGTVNRTLKNVWDPHGTWDDLSKVKKTMQGIPRLFGTGVEMLGKATELFEEATRIGAFMRAVKRVEKGKGYTRLASLDAATGGIKGYSKLMKGLLKGDMSVAKDAVRRYRGARKSVEAGGDIDFWDAMDEARELIVDYRRAGATGQVANSVYAFANAELQDMSRLARAMAEQPVATMTKAFAFLTIPTLANWYLNFDDPAYQMQSPTEKTLNFHPVGLDLETMKFGRIPKPIGLAQQLFGEAPIAFLNWAAFHDPEAVAEFEETIFGDLRVGRDEMLKRLAAAGFMFDPRLEERNNAARQGDPDALRDWVEEARDATLIRYTEALAPTVLQKIVDIQRNWNTFFDTPIVPRRYDFASPKPEDIENAGTSPIDHALAAGLRKIPFMDQVFGTEPNAIQARYLAGIGGSIGQTAVRGVDSAAQALGVFPDRPGLPKDVTQMTGVKAFWGRPIYGSGSDPENDFWRAYENMSEAYQSIVQHARANNMSTAIERLEKYPEVALYRYFDGARQQISKMQKVRREVRSMEEMSDEERLEWMMAIDKQKTLLADRVVNLYVAWRQGRGI